MDNSHLALLAKRDFDAIAAAMASDDNISSKKQRRSSVDDNGGRQNIRNDTPSEQPTNVEMFDGDNKDPASDDFCSNSELQPYPYFYYKNYSTVPDSDPLTPLTQSGRVPNFVAKMHAILSRDDLADVISWMPHGRSWRVLKPRDFECRVVPNYFEHGKFSSFIRQANGWGFRRFTTGKDRNSYYHPLFLRGLPHLCKIMKRPRTNQKLSLDPDHEPDLYEISKMYPVPDGSLDDNILLPSTLQNGPSARMPIQSIIATYTGAASRQHHWHDSPTQREKGSVSCIEQSESVREGETATQDQLHAAVLPQSSVHALHLAEPNFHFGGAESTSVLVAANQMAFAENPVVTNPQFAAGFAAATAMYQHQFLSMMQNHMHLQQQEKPHAPNGENHGQEK